MPTLEEKFFAVMEAQEFNRQKRSISKDEYQKDIAETLSSQYELSTCFEREALSDGNNWCVIIPTKIEDVLSVSVFLRYESFSEWRWKLFYEFHLSRFAEKLDIINMLKQANDRYRDQTK